jgi:1,4-dihydroxy-2-naphthoyl-CoA synthase
MAEVIVTMHGPVLHLKLNRPKRRNALTYTMIDQLLDALDREADLLTYCGQDTEGMVMITKRLEEMVR